MNLTRLRYFIAVAEELHFGRASARLHMAQPPLSQQIKLLESEIGSTLLTRTTRHVELTNAGRLLYPEAKRLVADSDRVERLMAGFRAGESGTLRVGFVDSASYEVMPRFLRSYRERWPGVTFELLTMSSDTQRGALTADELDIGIARTRGSEAGIDQTVLLEERLLVAVSSTHRLSHQKSTSLGRLVGETLIGFSQAQSPALSAELTAMLRDAGVKYEPVIEAEEYTTIVGLVAAGEGVAIVPASVQAFRPANLHYLQLRDSGATTRLLMLTRTGEQQPVVRQAQVLAHQLFN